MCLGALAIAPVVGISVILSASHSLVEVAVLGLLAGVIGYLLFRPAASAYFRGENAGASESEREQR